LERGRFQLPTSESGAVTEIDSTTLAMMLGGIDLDSAKRRKRYQVTPVVAVANAATPATQVDVACATSAP